MVECVVGIGGQPVGDGSRSDGSVCQVGSSMSLCFNWCLFVSQLVFVCVSVSVCLCLSWCVFVSQLVCVCIAVGVCFSLFVGVCLCLS